MPPKRKQLIEKPTFTQASDNTAVQRQVDKRAVQAAQKAALQRRRKLGLPDNATDEEVEKAEYYKSVQEHQAYIGPANNDQLQLPGHRQWQKEHAQYRQRIAEDARTYNKYAEFLGLETVDPETVDIRTLNNKYRNVGGATMSAGLALAMAPELIGYAPELIGSAASAVTNPTVTNFIGQMAGSMALGETANYASQLATGRTLGENLREGIRYYTGFQSDNPWWIAGTDIASNPWYAANPTSLGRGVNYYASQFANNWIPTMYRYAMQNPEITTGVMSGLTNYFSPELGSAIDGTLSASMQLPALYKFLDTPAATGQAMQFKSMLRNAVENYESYGLTKSDLNILNRYRSYMNERKPVDPNTKSQYEAVIQKIKSGPSNAVEKVNNSSQSAKYKVNNNIPLTGNEPDFIEYANTVSTTEPPNFGAGANPVDYVNTVNEWFEELPIGSQLALGDYQSTSTTPHMLRQMFKLMKQGRVKILPLEDLNLVETNDLGLLFGQDAKAAFDKRLDQIITPTSGYTPPQFYIPYSEAEEGSNVLKVPALRWIKLHRKGNKLKLI